MPDVAGVTNYPGSLDTTFTLLPVRDLESTTLDAPGVNATANVFPAIDTTGWPAAGFLTIEGEHCSYTGKTLTSYTGVSRGLFQTLGGSAPATHAAGVSIELLIIAATHEVHSSAIIAVETKLGTGADTPVSGDFLKGTGAGSSAWSPLTAGEINAALGFTAAPGIGLEESDASKVAVMSTLDVDGAYFSATDEGSGEGRLSSYSPILATGTLAIAGGIVTIPVAKGTLALVSAVVDTESAAASDDLDQISVTGTVADGTRAVLRTLAGARVVTVKHNAAKIVLENGQDFVMSSTSHRLELVKLGSIWYEIARQPANLRVGTLTQAWDADLDAVAAAIQNYFLPPGIMLDYGGAAAPTGWLLCDGSAVSRSTYAALFAAIGISYGAGNGSTTFNVPDRRDRFSIGKGVAAGSDALGETGGAATVTLTAVQSGLPAHNHAASAGTETVNHNHGFSDTYTSVSGIAGFATGGQTHTQVDAFPSVADTTGFENQAHAHIITVSNVAAAAASAAHENQPPYLTSNVIIKT